MSLKQDKFVIGDCGHTVAETQARDKVKKNLYQRTEREDYPVSSGVGIHIVPVWKDLSHHQGPDIHLLKQSMTS